MDKKKEKKKLRQEMKIRVLDLPKEYCYKADQCITEHLIETQEYQEAKSIFCYVGRAEEIDTKPILLDALLKGKRVGVPKCIEYGKMEVFQINNLDDLKEGAFGIMEPKESCRIIKGEEIGLAIVPCLSCNRKGVRLGYGGGYYDRYLSKTRCKKTILCRDRILCETIPEEVHDVLMDMVITEIEVIYC